MAKTTDRKSDPGAKPVGGAEVIETDVAIVGGGLAGATLALILAKARPDLGIMIVEAGSLAGGGRDLPSFDERTTAIAPTSQQVFEELDVWSTMAPFATPIASIHVSDRQHLGAVTFGPEDHGGQPLGYVVKNRGMGKALLEALSQRPIEALANTRVTKVTAIANGMTLTLGDGRCLRSRLLVVADGAESPLRRQLGIGVATHDYRQSALIANVAIDRAHQGRAYERFSANGALALLPLADDRNKAYGLVWSCASARAASLMSLDDTHFLAELQREFGYRAGRFVAIGQRHAYPLTLRRALEQVRSNVVLMGNAAHFLHPVAGQGFNLTLRDNLRLAQVLGELPSEDIGRLALLQEYVAWQGRDQDTTVFLSHNFNRWFGEQRFGVPYLRTLAFTLLSTAPVVREQFLLAMSGRAARQAQPWS